MTELELAKRIERQTGCRVAGFHYPNGNNLAIDVEINGELKTVTFKHNKELARNHLRGQGAAPLVSMVQRLQNGGAQ